MKKSMECAPILIALGIFAIAVQGCVSSSGQTKDDTTLTDTAKDLAPKETGLKAYKGPKLRVGVVNFENRTPSKVLGIGDAAADILGTILQKTERFIVIPQQDIHSILDQQKLGTSGAINPDTAAKMGEIMGLNAIVTGSVTAYSEAEESFDALVYQKKKRIARVTVDYRIVDTTTGVQLMADSGAGIYEKVVFGALGLGGRASGDPDLRDGALRNALTKAMVNMMKKLESRKWTGRIAQVEDNVYYINAGQKTGLNVGDKLDVYRSGKDIVDPVTKMKLGKTETLVGQISVSRNDIGDTADVSVAVPVSGSGFKIGDIVRISGQ